jgi:CPA1 family monovalent cation:H+ antiporter
MWGMVFGVAAILTVAVLMLPIADRSKIPYTVILAVIGMGFGFLVQYLGLGDQPATAQGEESLWIRAIGAISAVNITPNVVLYVFLPALIFESSLTMDHRKVLEDIIPILFLAVVGVIVSIVIVGVALAPYTGMGLSCASSSARS